MKSSILFILAAFLFIGTAQASSGDLFSYDKSQVKERLQEADLLEGQVLSVGVNAFQSAQEMGYSNFELASFAPNFSYEPPLGIPSFWWGFCFSATGIGIVYFVADDRDETMSALKGCVVGGLVYTGCYIIYIVAIVASI